MESQLFIKTCWVPRVKEPPVWKLEREQLTSQARTPPQKVQWNVCSFWTRIITIFTLCFLCCEFSCASSRHQARWKFSGRPVQKSEGDWMLMTKNPILPGIRGSSLQCGWPCVFAGGTSAWMPFHSRCTQTPFCPCDTEDGSENTTILATVKYLSFKEVTW